MTIVALLIGLGIGLAIGSFGVWFALRVRLSEHGSLPERIEAAVNAASTEALRANSGQFAELAQAKLDVYVAPLRESLGKVETQVIELERARKEAYGALTEGVRLLRAEQERLRAETGNLVTALRAPQVRGRWGEIQLRRVLELAGMLAHCDFVEQETVTDTEGRMLRPDVVIRLPGGKSVVIDSKVPLVSYLDAHSEDATAEDRLRHLTSHARLVRDHVQKLGQKAYWRQFDPSPEFVVMFLPDEAFLRAALDHDASLLEFSIDNKVLPASPTNLIGLLHAIHYGWQQEAIAEGAREVSALGRELYGRISTLGTHFSELGKQLGKAVGKYNEAVGSLERSVLPQARRFAQHGITGDPIAELDPIELQVRSLAAPELVGDPEADAG